MIAASNTKALQACRIGPGISVQIEDSETELSFAGVAPFSIEAHFYIEPSSEPILPPGHQQGPAQWHGHQVLISKFNGCVCGEYRLGLDAQRRVIFQREVEPWIVTTPDPIPTHEWHSVVATYDGRTMRIYVDSRLAVHVACGAQKADTTSPVILGADLCGYATAHHFEGYLSEVSVWRRCLDAADVRLLAQHGPTGHPTLTRELTAYWCLYQRTETAGGGGRAAGSAALVYNGARPHGGAGGAGALNGGAARYRGRVVSEGVWAVGRYRSWLYSACATDALDNDDGGIAPPLAEPPPALGGENGGGEGAGGGRTTGVLFSAASRSHMRICGSASALSFGDVAPYTLAVQFYPRAPPADTPALAGGGGGGGADGGGGGGEQTLLSKFNRGLRGEYRLGLDASGRPFTSREAEPWALLAPEPVAAHRWHSVVAAYDGATLRLFVDYVEVASAPSGAQFSDQVTPVLIGCDMERDRYVRHFEGFVAEACVWARALQPAEVAELATTAPAPGTPLQRGLLGCWRLLESKQLRLHSAGRVVVPNAASARAPAGAAAGARLPGADANGGHVGAAAPGGGGGGGADGGADGGGGPRPPGGVAVGAREATHAVLRTAVHTHTLGVVMRPGVQALVVELGAVGHDLSRHWVGAVSRLGTQSMRLRREQLAQQGLQGGGGPAGAARAAAARLRAAAAPTAPAATPAPAPGGGGPHAPACADIERRYCYVGMSVALQKNLTQALDLHANEVLVTRLSHRHAGPDEHALRRLHAEYKQKLLDVRGRAWSLFRDWFFDNPVHALRECDGDRCEFWRFKFPARRVRACQVLVEHAVRAFPPKAHCPLVVASFGSGLLFQDFCTTQMLLDAGFRHIRLALVDTAYRPWKERYLGRDATCRAHVVPAAMLDEGALLPEPVAVGPADSEETISNAAATSCNNAISFVLYNEALHQFVQWFSCVPDADVQVLVYDSVEAYAADCRMAPDEMEAMVCSAMDYKDNETLLEEAVNQMLTTCLSHKGFGVKLVTKPSESVPGVYVVDRQLRELYHEQLPSG